MPQLVRYYGGAPMTWLRETPLAVVEAHVAMVKEMRAAEAMHAATVAGIGRLLEAGSWAQDQWREWGRAAEAGRPVKRGPVPAGIGIGTRTVRRGVKRG